MILWQCCKENIFISVYTKYRNKNIVVGMFQEKNVSGKCCSNVFTTLSQCWQRFYNVFTTFWQLFMERNVVTTFFRVDKSTLWQHWLWNVAQRFWFPGKSTKKWVFDNLGQKYMKFHFRMKKSPKKPKTAL